MLVVSIPSERRMTYWTERDDAGRIWLCWYEPMRDPRESRSILTRTLIGRPARIEVAAAHQ